MSEDDGGCDEAAGRAVVAPAAALASLVCRQLASRGEPGPRRLVDGSGQAHRRYEAVDGCTMLIRPDGYVLGRWPVLDADAVRAALSALCGGPMRQVAVEALPATR